MEYKYFNLINEGWDDYFLLDSGGGKKLERFGDFLITRPEPQAIWAPRNLKMWSASHAEFVYENGKGRWKKHSLPLSWNIKFENFKFILKTNSFKHIGIFPEQSPNWLWVKEKAAFLSGARVLNLFGYTGIIDLFLGSTGAEVVHIDSSAQSNMWARENVKIAGLESKVKILLDDVLKFTKREVKRGSFYDGIILDPPAFGRGPKGEIWRIEKDLPQLLENLRLIFKSRKNSFFLLNSYAAGYSPWSLKQLVEDYFSSFEILGEFGEMQIQEKNTSHLLPSGIYVRFVVK